MTKTRSNRRITKSGWRVFLSPSWIFTFIFVVLFSYLAFTILSPWQLNKDHDIKERNERITAAFAVDPVDYSEVFASDGSISQEDLEWRRVTLKGHYVAGSEVLLRMRSVNETPNYQSLVGFETDAGDFFLVHRGYVPTAAGSMPDIPAPPTGEVTITGVARYTEGVPTNAPMEADGYQQVYGINTQQISDITGLELGVDYIQLLEDNPGVLTAMPIPQLDRGNHLSYGLQWIAFGIMAPLGLGYFIWSEIRERRKVAAEEAAMAQRVVAAGAPPAPSEAEGSDTALAAEPGAQTADSSTQPVNAPEASSQDANSSQASVQTPLKGAAASTPLKDAASATDGPTSSGSSEAAEASSTDAGTPAPAASPRRSRYGTTHQNRWAKKNDRRKNF